MQSKSCDASPAVSAHAHVITDAVARDLSSCVLRAFKRSQKVWPSVCRAKAQNIHFYACFRHSSTIGSSVPNTVSTQELSSLSVQHQIIQISGIKLISSQQKFDLIADLIHVLLSKSILALGQNRNCDGRNVELAQIWFVKCL